MQQRPSTPSTSGFRVPLWLSYASFQPSSAPKEWASKGQSSGILKQSRASIAHRSLIMGFQVVGKETPVQKSFCKGTICCETIKFTLHKPVRQSYSTPKFLEVASAGRMSWLLPSITKPPFGCTPDSEILPTCAAYSSPSLSSWLGLSNDSICETALPSNNRRRASGE